MSREILPVADARAVRTYAREVAASHPRALTVVLVLHAAAAAVGLVVPRLVGDLVQAVAEGTTRDHVDLVVLLVGLAVLAQTVLTRYARLASTTFGESVLATLREDFVVHALQVPLGTVEKAGTGDLLTRSSRDVEGLGWSVRFAVPETIIALVTVVFTVVASVLVGWWVLLPILAGVPILWVGTRWYLRRAKPGYLRENASYAAINATLAETVEGARTIETYGLAGARRRQIDADVAESFAAERYTLGLRSVYFPVAEMAYLIPTVATLILGGVLYGRGEVSLSDVTAAVLYVQFLIDPIDRLLGWLDELQVGGASLARLLGVGLVPDDRTPTGAHPRDVAVDVDAAEFSYVTGRPVLHGVDLHLAPGERLAVVGPSGAGKSTLGRLLAGINPPTAGRVTIGGVPVTDLALDELRGQVVLVTQEHHVFAGTLRENLSLALDLPGEDALDPAVERRLHDALAAVDADGWALGLPEGLDTVVGSGGHALTDAQAQQLALARLVLADPHTLVLDEATSMIDPRAARHLERSLAAVLRGRTVVAIAHRLTTAHDADRVAVVEDGRISEIGTHDELVAAGGSYAALWRSWHG